ncbi:MULTISPECIES: hypothetical protein [unclassified Frigoribacterium]|nr:MULTISPECIES: hypothetical protein [unclassified Frigoribacterium]
MTHPTATARTARAADPAAASAAAEASPSADRDVVGRTRGAVV